ncbi:hypothetical protein D3C84_883710 [compost metagenome]
MLGNNRDFTFQRRIDTADLDRLHRALVGKHALHLDQRRDSEHLRVFQRSLGRRAPVSQWLHTENTGMRHHAEDPRAHFALKTVHHRQHHDHRQHTQGQADHRGHGNERDEMVAALGAGVARADENRQGSEHERSTRVKKRNQVPA